MSDTDPAVQYTACMIPTVALDGRCREDCPFYDQCDPDLRAAYEGATQHAKRRKHRSLLK